MMARESVGTEDARDLSAMHGRKDPASVLADVFKHSEYKPYQKRVVELVMDGKDVLFVSATNSGKSLCYQLPAFCLPGVALVVTPLTALIDDQLGKIRDVGIGAAALHSGRVHGDEQLFHEFMAGNITAHGKLKILLLTPEAFHKGQRAETLRSAVQRLYGDGLLSLVVFDEVHCFREWGWSFRCSYLQFNQLRREMGLVLTPILCLTATISTAHGESTTRMLGMRNVETVTGELSRFNVATEVVQKTSNRVVNLAKHIVELCMGRFRGMLGLVYCTSPADCRKLRDMLVADFAKAGFGISIAIYHGDLSPEEKQEAQSRFMGDCVELLLATNAFGMGIDKPGLRFVLHTSFPPSLEQYIQEIGRAGRDGKQAWSIVFYRREDMRKNYYLVDKENLIRKINQNCPRVLTAAQEVIQDKLDAVRIASYVFSGGATGYDCLRTNMLLLGVGKECQQGHETTKWPCCSFCSTRQLRIRPKTKSSKRAKKKQLVASAAPVAEILIDRTFMEYDASPIIAAAEWLIKFEDLTCQQVIDILRGKPPKPNNQVKPSARDVARLEAAEYAKRIGLYGDFDFYSIINLDRIFAHLLHKNIFWEEVVLPESIDDTKSLWPVAYLRKSGRPWKELVPKTATTMLLETNGTPKAKTKPKAKVPPMEVDLSLLDGEDAVSIVSGVLDIDVIDPALFNDEVDIDLGFSFSDVVEVTNPLAGMKSELQQCNDAGRLSNPHENEADIIGGDVASPSTAADQTESVKSGRVSTCSIEDLTQDSDDDDAASKLDGTQNGGITGSDVDPLQDTDEDRSDAVAPRDSRKRRHEDAPQTTLPSEMQSFRLERCDSLAEQASNMHSSEQQTSDGSSIQSSLSSKPRIEVPKPSGPASPQESVDESLDCGAGDASVSNDGASEPGTPVSDVAGEPSVCLTSLPAGAKAGLPSRESSLPTPSDGFQKCSGTTTKKKGDLFPDPAEEGDREAYSRLIRFFEGVAAKHSRRHFSILYPNAMKVIEALIIHRPQDIGKLVALAADTTRHIPHSRTCWPDFMKCNARDLLACLHDDKDVVAVVTRYPILDSSDH